MVSDAVNVVDVIVGFDPNDILGSGLQREGPKEK